jgi:hypothetical protein
VLRLRGLTVVQQLAGRALRIDSRWTEPRAHRNAVSTTCSPSLRIDSSDQAGRLASIFRWPRASLPERQAFVAKCVALLRKGVAVSLVDLVTIRRFNLYAQLMEFIGPVRPVPFVTSTTAEKTMLVAR